MFVKWAFTCKCANSICRLKIVHPWIAIKKIEKTILSRVCFMCVQVFPVSLSHWLISNDTNHGNTKTDWPLATFHWTKQQKTCLQNVQKSKSEQMCRARFYKKLTKFFGVEHKKIKVTVIIFFYHFVLLAIYILSVEKETLKKKSKLAWNVT